MIKIPVGDLNPQENEELVIICNALFIEVEDTRFISMISDETREERASIIRESSLCEDLYNMVSFFGNDLVEFLKPVLVSLAKEDYLTSEYLETFEKHIKEVL